MRIICQLDIEIDRFDARIAELYADADPKKIVLSVGLRAQDLGL